MSNKHEEYIRTEEYEGPSRCSTLTRLPTPLPQVSIYGCQVKGTENKSYQWLTSKMIRSRDEGT